ncbi:monocarboxylate transporter 9-like isoform X2 [Bradysia coprophila]|uniref:monocarboxylate transporter 9-like isoform X2 n=1 Tax=Bradysia coprophila TaxID=38358 RepID=UPI00187DA899|nr:monocarboxylate transporter 9-like isoform X2 [Bradysia coprophila]
MKNTESKRHGPTVQQKSKKSQRFESTIREVNIVIPPDGGYAWIIVIAAFMCNFALDGIAFSFSVAILPGLSKALNVHPSKLTVISSAQLGVSYLVGPVACAFINHYGFRSLAVCGSLVAFVGIFVASHMESFPAIITLYGVIVGIAFGMLYTAATISVGYYFEKYRALATGLASCGSSFGGLCLSPLFAYTTATKSWDFTIKDTINTPSRVEFVELYKTDSMVSIDLDDKSEESRHFPQISIISSRFLPISEVKRKRRKRCLWIRDLCSSQLTHSTGKPNVMSTGPMDRKDIFYAASVAHLPEYKMAMTSENSELNRKRMVSYHLSMVLDPEMILPMEASKHSNAIEFHDDTSTCFGVPHIIHKVLGNLFDISLLKSTVFCTLALSCFCYALGYMTPYLYLQQRGETNNIPAGYTNWFISWISVGNVLGRFSSGVFVTLFSHFNECYLVGWASILAGIVTILSAYIGTDAVAVQICYCIVFGFTIAFFGALRPVVFVKLLGLKKLTNAFGLSALVLGIGVLSGTPIVTGLYEKTGSLLWTFVLSGGLFIASGVLTILAFLIDLWQKRNNKK